MTRIEKKEKDLYRDFNQFLEWIQDYRAYLIEGLDEGIDLSILHHQFKRRMTTRGVRNRFFSRGRMSHYAKVALDISN